MLQLRTLAKRILIAALLASSIVYAADFVSFRARMLHPKPDNPLETVTALRILAIEQKGGKTEYTIDQLQPQQTAICVHSLFPHAGDPPCWYIKRKFAQPIPMSIFLFPELSSVGLFCDAASVQGRRSFVPNIRARLKSDSDFGALCICHQSLCVFFLLAHEFTLISACGASVRISPSHLATTTHARQFPNTFTAVRPISIS